ncbi:MAG: DUF3617 family protein [Casimicrobiaceae bacterium]
MASKIVLNVALVLGIASMPALAADGMQPGLWELKMSINQYGRVRALPPARECITQADIDNGNRILPRPDGACSLSNVDRSSARATYDVACAQETFTTKGRAEIRFAGIRYDGTVDLTVTEKGGDSMPLSMTIAARRLADCSK